MTAFVSRKQVELTRYESQLKVQLPDALRGCLLLKQASLSKKQGTRVTTLMDGNRSEETVRAALSCLDTDLDVMSYATGHPLSASVSPDSFSCFPRRPYAQAKRFCCNSFAQIKYHDLQSHDVFEIGHNSDSMSLQKSC